MESPDQNMNTERRKLVELYSKHNAIKRALRFLFLGFVVCVGIFLSLSFYNSTKEHDRNKILKAQNALNQLKNYESKVDSIEYTNDNLQTTIKAKKALQKGSVLHFTDVEVQLHKKQQTIVAPKVTVNTGAGNLRAEGGVIYKDRQGLSIIAKTLFVGKNHVIHGKDGVQAKKNNIEIEGNALMYNTKNKFLSVKGNVAITVNE